VSPGAAPAGRPRLVGWLGYLFLGIAAALMISAALETARAAQTIQKSGWSWAWLLPILPARVLPAIWVGTAGWGMLKGRGWSRALVGALAVLALVAFAGLVSSPDRSPLHRMQVGTALALLLLTGGATWYLCSSRAADWFRSRGGL
jgi:hypothetical protein